MKILFIVLLSTIISLSGIYFLREKVFKVNDKAPDNNLISNDNNFYKLTANDIDGNIIDFSKFEEWHTLQERYFNFFIFSYSFEEANQLSKVVSQFLHANLYLIII